MSSEEKARHLVEDHGFDHDYFNMPSDSDVVDAFTVETITDNGGDSYPHPSRAWSWHSVDHEDFWMGGGKVPHAHP